MKTTQTKEYKYQDHRGEPPRIWLFYAPDSSRVVCISGKGVTKERVSRDARELDFTRYFSSRERAVEYYMEKGWRREPK